MIPYVALTTIPLGPVHIQVWGLFVAAGIGAALLVGSRKAATYGLDKGRFLDLATWTIVGALIGARLGHAAFYAPAQYAADPWELLRVWDGGMSSIGGFVGAAVAAAVFCRTVRIPLLRYAEPAIFALPLGQGIGRIGCFLIHDHPGTLSDSMFAVAYPGGARLDHGLLLSLVGFVMFTAFLALGRYAARSAAPFYLPLFMVTYGIVRFLLDAFRAQDIPLSDARYLGLTPAQYGMLLLAGGGVVLYLRSRGPRPRPETA